MSSSELNNANDSIDDLTDELSSISLDKEDEGALIDPSIDTLPYNAYVGFYTNIKESEVKEYIYSYAEKNFDTLTNVFYQIVKHNGGFAYEIHQGGNGKGFLKSITSIINQGEESVLLTSSAFYKIYDKGGDLKALKLRDNDNDVLKTLIYPEQKDTLKPLTTKGYAFHVFGLCMAAVGVLALLTAFSFKYLILSKEEQVYFTPSGKYTPMLYIEEIKKQNRTMSRNDEYITSITYTEADSWNINKEKVIFKKEEEVSTPESIPASASNDEKIDRMTKKKRTRKNRKKLTVGEGED